MHPKPVIGLAGGIGSGKSAVAKILADLGCVVADSDRAARAALDDPDVRRRIVEEFGEGVLQTSKRPGTPPWGDAQQDVETSEESNQVSSHAPRFNASNSDVRPFGRSAGSPIDRGALASIVFADPAKRRILEAIIHPWVEQRRLEQFAAAPGEAPALVIDAPLLFEAELDRKCDAVIFIDSPRSTRLERVHRCRGWDESELDRRERSQMPLDEKRERADHVLRNDGSLEELAKQTRRILATIVRARRTR